MALFVLSFRRTETIVGGGNDMSKQMVLENGLHIGQMTDGSYVCQEMKSMAKRFNSQWSQEAINEVVAKHMDIIRGECYARRDKREDSSKETEEQKNYTTKTDTNNSQKYNTRHRLFRYKRPRVREKGIGNCGCWWAQYCSVGATGYR